MNEKMKKDVKLVADADAVIFGDAFTAGKFDLCKQLLKDNDLLALYAKEQLLDCIKQKENSENA